MFPTNMQHMYFWSQISNEEASLRFEKSNVNIEKH